MFQRFFNSYTRVYYIVQVNAENKYQFQTTFVLANNYIITSVIKPSAREKCSQVVISELSTFHASLVPPAGD